MLNHVASLNMLSALSSCVVLFKPPEIPVANICVEPSHPRSLGIMFPRLTDGLGICVLLRFGIVRVELMVFSLLV